MRISLDICMPPPPPASHKEVDRGVDVFEKVKDYIKLINSQDESEHEWKYLKALYNTLVNKAQLNQAQKEILYTLEPEILKHHGYDSGEDQLKVDGSKLFRVKERDL